MNLRIFILTALLSLCALDMASSADRHRSILKGPVAVTVLRVVDGDTFLARAQVWLGQDITVLVRIRGIDAPEMKAKCAQERSAALAATTQLTAILAQSAVELRNISGEKYFGRVLADIVTDKDKDPAALMLQSALVRPYSGKKRQPWC